MKPRSFILRVVVTWIPLAIVITALCGLTYLVGQQIYRISANDPQIQMAQDAAVAIFNGATPTSVVPSESVDVSASLAPFLIVYDRKGIPIAGTGMLENTLPQPPLGVLQAAAQTPQGNAVTWEPRPGLRIASVSMAVDQNRRSDVAVGGTFYVLSGRNLREVEIRENNLLKIAELAWIVTIVVSLLAVMLLEAIAGRITRPKGEHSSRGKASKAPKPEETDEAI